jgi:taurine dioxygenase
MLYLLKPLAPTFGAEVEGLNLSSPVGSKVRDRLVADLLAHRLLVVPRQDLDHAGLVRVSRWFGHPEVHVLTRHVVTGHPEVTIVSNIFADGEPIGLYDGDNEIEWHTDYSWKAQMSKASLLYAVLAPSEGGATLFADTTAAYDDLAEAVRQRIGDLHAVHSMEHLSCEQAKCFPEKAVPTSAELQEAPDVVHPLVRAHPVTGRRSLLLGDMVIRGIVGMPPPDSRALLEELLTHATGHRYVYRHSWARGDLVIWDNRATMHTATPCDRHRSQRLLYRITTL